MTKTFAFILAATLAACAAQAEVHYSGDGANPELVAMDDHPGVMVVANADEPTFYVDHSFWLYRDNIWYRSSSHRANWTRAGNLPVAVTQISQPTGYVHYRHSEAQPRTAEPIVRDHREMGAPPAAPPAGGEVRDHRDQQMMHGREPNAQGASPPHANPLPPNQVPPAGDARDGRDGRDGRP